MKQKNWIAVILVGAVAVNGVAYVALRARDPSPPVAGPPRVASLPRTNPTPPVEPAPAPEPPANPITTPPAPVAPPEEDNPGLARAHRASGLAALEDRDYDKAVAEFTEALHLRKDKGDLVDLLRIAEELRSRGQAKTARVEPSRPAREPPAPSRSSAKSRPVRTASRAQAKEEPESDSEGARGGLLLVTSTPPGLVVQVDGKARDLTPARLPLPAGRYRVALSHGERRLLEELVDVKEDSVQSLNRDLTAELAPAAPPPTVATRPAPEPVVASAAVAASGTPRPPPAPEPSANTGGQSAQRTEPAVARVADKGDLDVTSPSLYGEVWINNRPYGFPPVTARGLPSGPARVEVRVNGEVKRRMTVEVEPGRRTAIRVR